MLAACGGDASPMIGGSGGDIDAGRSIDAAVPGPGCAALPMTCGSSGHESCCSSPAVPGGTYFRSYDTADGEYSDMRFAATVSGFRLDKFEVTVGRFRAFVNAGMGTQISAPAAGAGAHAQIPGSGWDATWNTFLAENSAALAAAVRCDPTFETWTDMSGANESRPMNCLTWYEAMAFCAWDGGFLPTEAEWNLAAAGGDEQRAYPWSAPPASPLILDSSHASYSDATGCGGDGVPACTRADLTPVGTKSLGDGRWGQSDLAGNVYEWTLDMYAATYTNPCEDCAVLTGSSARVIRGGSLVTVAVGLRAASRVASMSTRRDYAVGARCARAP
jgi:formylglycine-generating enzyme required for sulfatase activity